MVCHQLAVHWEFAHLPQDLGEPIDVVLHALYDGIGVGP